MQLAETMDLPCTVIPCSKRMTLTNLIGYRNADGNYIPTAFHGGFNGGHVLVIDESDKASGDVNVAFNSLIANGVMLFPDGKGTVKKHPDTIIILTGNTRMSGASASYNAAMRQDESLKNRLTFINWDYDTKLETALTRAECKAYGGDWDDVRPWLDYVRKVRKQIEKMGLSYVAGPRQSMAGARLISKGLSIEDTQHDVLYGWMRNEDTTRIKEAM